MSTLWPAFAIQYGGTVRRHRIGTGIARFLNRLSVRQRFLMGPVLGLLLLVALTGILMMEMGRQNDLLAYLGDREMAEYDHFANVLEILEREHLGLSALLQDVGKLGEAELYDRAKERIEGVHKALGDLTSLLANKGADRKELASLQALVVSYLRSATAALTNSTIDPSLAAQRLARTNEKYMNMKRAFGHVLKAQRDIVKTEIAARVEHGKKTRIAIALAGVVCAVILLTLSRFLSQLLAKSLEDQIAAITALGAKAGVDVEFWGATEVDRIALSLGAFDIAVTQLQRHDAEMAAKNHILAATNKELADRNQELDAFSYTVSHDLRGPLRAIDGFGAALDEEYGSQLDHDAKRYLERIRAGTCRMGELIDDLLNLASVSRSALEVKELDLSRLAREVFESLLQRDPARRVEIIIPDDMAARADERLLRIALENLIGNAWKYTRAVERPCIQLGCARKESGSTYFIRDNGAGFDMEYADKLFVPFQRLHSADQFPGTGIGLATVKRIMDRHNACIWAESKVEQGSTFYFSLGECHER